jgi:hypothetical protein
MALPVRLSLLLLLAGLPFCAAHPSPLVHDAPHEFQFQKALHSGPPFSLVSPS